MIPTPCDSTEQIRIDTSRLLAAFTIASGPASQNSKPR